MKILLIGHGYWGSKLRERFDKLLGVENVVVCDTDAAKLPTEPNRRAFRGTFSDWPLEDSLDACVIATPPPTHYTLAKECLINRKDCLVEKPLCIEAHEAHELLDIAIRQQLTLMCDDTWSYHDAARAQLIHVSEKHQTVDIHLQWMNPRQETPQEGILYTLGPHPVSLAIQAAGERPNQVMGHLEPRTATILYRFSQSSARIDLSWDTDQRVRRFIQFSNTERIDRASLFDDAYMTPDRDPLTVMCEAFLRRIGNRWLDLQAIWTVETLHYTHRCLTHPNLVWPHVKMGEP